MALRRAWLLACRSLVQEHCSSLGSRSAASEPSGLLPHDLAASARQLVSLRDFQSSVAQLEASKAATQQHNRKRSRRASARPKSPKSSQYPGDSGGATASTGPSQVKWPAFDDISHEAEARGPGEACQPPLTEPQVQQVKGALANFQESSEVKDQALALYINAQLFPEVAKGFIDFLWRGMTPALAAALTGRQEEVREALFDLFAPYALQNYNREIQLYREIVQTVDLTRPHLWYSAARSMPRRLVYHAGPTNSGKTFSALQAMSKAETGIYCGPLRLLAMEVYDSLNAQGTLCNLLTGQERREVPGARHVACTIEMANLNQPYDIAVIDEIQLLGDEARGWAWTRALQGLLAREVHVCGDGSALALVGGMAEAMHEPLEVQQYERFTPLLVEPEGLRQGYQDVQPGDCIVAFSRRDIYDIKNTIEATTGSRVCVVYGALPPEMRRQQAKLFNDPDNDYNLMVASDAVGMGLNLNIRRIVFHTLHKLEGRQRTLIPVTQIKQIAGRAGRRSSRFRKGLVTCLNQEDVPHLAAALDTPLEELVTSTAGLFPDFTTLEAFAGQLLLDDFGAILRRFGEDARLEGTYFLCRQESVMRAALLLSRVEGLSLQERFWFCMAPANLRDARVAAALLQFATRYAAQQTVPFDVAIPGGVPGSPDKLMAMEATHQILSLWLWLSYRFRDDAFPGRDIAQSLSDNLISLMEDGLQGMCAPRAFGSAVNAAMCVVCHKAGPRLSQLASAKALPRAAAPRNGDHKQAPEGRKGEGVSARTIWMCPDCRQARRQAVGRTPVSLLQQSDSIVGEFLHRWGLARRHGSDLLSASHAPGWWLPKQTRGPPAEVAAQAKS